MIATQLFDVNTIAFCYTSKKTCLFFMQNAQLLHREKIICLFCPLISVDNATVCDLLAKNTPFPSFQMTSASIRLINNIVFLAPLFLPHSCNRHILYHTQTSYGSEQGRIVVSVKKPCKMKEYGIIYNRSARTLIAQLYVSFWRLLF